MRTIGSISRHFGEFEFRKLLSWLFAVLVYAAVNHGTELVGVMKSADGWRSLLSGVAVVAGRGFYVWYRDYSNRFEVR